MLHPMLIVPLGKILPRMRAPRLLPIGRRLRRLHRARQQIPQLERLDQIAIPNHAAILHAHVLEAGIDVLDPPQPFVQRLLRPKHGDVGLHDLLHGAADVVRGLGPGRGADGVEGGDGVGASVGADGRVRLAGRGVVAHRVRDRAAEDDEVEQRVGAQAVGAVHGDAGGFAAGVQARHDDVVALRVDVEHLARVLGRDAAHVVVHRG